MCFMCQKLGKYITSPTHVLEANNVQFWEDLSIDVRPMRVLDSQVNKLRAKEIRTMKVLCDEATQEAT